MRKVCSAALLVLAASIVVLRADDPPAIGAIHLYHPIAQGFQVRTFTSGGYAYTNVTNGYQMIFRCTAGEPNLPTFSVSNEGSFAIMKALSHNSGPNGSKRCCRWIYGPIETGRTLNLQGDLCVTGEGGCQSATLECSGGWENCPVGWGDPNASVLINVGGTP